MESKQTKPAAQPAQKQIQRQQIPEAESDSEDEIIVVKKTPKKPKGYLCRRFR